MCLILCKDGLRVGALDVVLIFVAKETNSCLSSCIILASFSCMLVMVAIRLSCFVNKPSTLFKNPDGTGRELGQQGNM